MLSLEQVVSRMIITRMGYLFMTGWGVAEATGASTDPASRSACSIRCARRGCGVDTKHVKQCPKQQQPQSPQSPQQPTNQPNKQTDQNQQSINQTNNTYIHKRWVCWTRDCVVMDLCICDTHFQIHTPVSLDQVLNVYTFWCRGVFHDISSPCE